MPASDFTETLPELAEARDRQSVVLTTRLMRQDLRDLNAIAQKREMPVSVLLAQLVHGVVRKLAENEC
ncbi:MAG TPA: hypothetical protein VFB39_07075 [Solirubrobacteraceae bacterium]|nr:hypothetical protein [Solirubrobacteraceae bacterium]